MPADYHGLLEQRLLGLFERYAQEKDVSPAQRFRLEGYIQAGIEVNLITVEEVLRLKKDCAKQIFGAEASVELWSDDLGVPAMMKRAPVRPSTK